VVGLRRDGGSILIMDPAEGWRDQPLNTFLAEWGRTQRVTLVVLSSVKPEATRRRSLTGAPSEGIQGKRVSPVATCSSMCDRQQTEDAVLDSGWPHD